VDSVFESDPDISGVIVALGGKTKDVGPTMLTDGTSCIVSAMKNKSTAKRIAVVTSIGGNLLLLISHVILTELHSAGDSENQAPFFFKALMFTVMKGIFEDKNNQEKLFLSPTGPGYDLE